MTYESKLQKPSPWDPNHEPPSTPSQTPENQEIKSEMSDFVKKLKTDRSTGAIVGSDIEEAYKNASEADRIAILENIFAEKPKSEYKFYIIDSALHDSDKASEVARNIISKNLSIFAQELKDAYVQDGTKKTAAQDKAIRLLRLEENAYGRSFDQMQQLQELNSRAAQEQHFQDSDTAQE